MSVFVGYLEEGRQSSQSLTRELLGELLVLEALAFAENIDGHLLRHAGDVGLYVTVPPTFGTTTQGLTFLLHDLLSSY